MRRTLYVSNLGVSESFQGRTKKKKPGKNIMTVIYYNSFNAYLKACHEKVVDFKPEDTIND